MKRFHLLCLVMLGLTQAICAQTLSNQTITESTQKQELTEEDIGASYDFKKISEELLGNFEAEQMTSSPTDTEAHVLIGFSIEFLITTLVLQIVLVLNGLSGRLAPAVALSFAVAMIGALLEYFLNIGLLNPIRIVLSFLLLLALLRPLANTRKWPATIRIAVLTRLISLALIWLSYIGAMALFEL